jgi:hypothetical protein
VAAPRSRFHPELAEQTGGLTERTGSLAECPATEPELREADTADLERLARNSA